MTIDFLQINKSFFVGWTENRVKEYFVWAFKVVEGLRGTNEKLEKQLDLLFEKREIS